MKILMKTLAAVTAASMLTGGLAGIAYAEGSYSIDNNYLVLRPGETATVTINAENAAGRVDWDSDGSVTAVGSAWLDNGNATIEITADQAGTGYITVYPDPERGIATYDEEMLDYSYTITVEVVDDNEAVVDDTITDTDTVEEPANNAVADDAQEQGAAQAPEDNGNAPQDEPAQEQPAQEQQPQEQQNQEQPAQEQQPEENAQNVPQAQAAAGDALTDGNNDYADLSEEDRLYTTVDGQELYIIQYPLWQDEEGGTVWNDEILNLDILNGFEYETVNYKDINVDTFRNNNLRVFVLKNLETDVSRYYVLDENGGGFSPLPYVTVNSRQYIVEKFPAGFSVPEGYQLADMTLADSTVQALKLSPDGIKLRGYDVMVSPGLESADPSQDIYYIYCMVDGETQLYAYDSGEGTLQRASILAFNEIPTEPETVIIYETQPAAPEVQTETAAPSILKGIGWNGMQIQIKVLLVALAVAIILLIILIIAFAVMSRRKKKGKKNNNKNKRNNRPGKGSSRDAIPPRTTSRDRRPHEEDSIFSYVKTESDEFDINDLK